MHRSAASAIRGLASSPPAGTRASASVGQRATQAPQPPQAAASGAATKPLFASTCGAPNSARPRRKPQQQRQQLQMKIGSSRTL